MKSTKKISFLIILLLVNFLITSCGCSKKKIDPLVREEKRLKNSLKEQCSQEGWKKLEEKFEQDKTSTEKINQHIQRLLTLQEEVNNFDKFITAIVFNVVNSGGRPSSEQQQKLKNLLELISLLKQCPKEIADKKIEDLLKQNSSSIQQFKSLTNPTTLQLIGSFLTNQLDLWRNLKKQLETKGTEEGGNDSN